MAEIALRALDRLVAELQLDGAWSERAWRRWAEIMWRQPSARTGVGRHHGGDGVRRYAPWPALPLGVVSSTDACRHFGQCLTGGAKVVRHGREWSPSGQAGVVPS